MVRWMGDGEKNEMARLRRDLELQRKDLQKERQALALEHQKLALGQLAAVREKAREQQDELGKQIEATVKVDIDRHLKEIFEEQKALLEEHKQVAKRQAELAKQRANDAIGDLHSDHVVVPDVSLAVPIPPLSPVPLALPGIDVQIPHPGLAGPGMDDPFHVEKNPLEALRHQRERVRGDIKNLSQRLKGLEKELDRIEDQLEREQERREERAK